MHGHLIAVEVGVKGGTNERMDLDRLALNEHRFKSLDSEAVKRGRAVQQDRVILDDLFENVPNDRILLLDKFLSLLDCRAVPALFEPVIDKRLEQLQRHF